VNIKTGCTVVPIIYLVVFSLLATACFAPLEYTCEFWLSYANERPVDIPASYCWVAALVPPIAIIGGVVGGGVTLLLSSGIDNPYYLPN
jgi:hypothetical protein